MDDIRAICAIAGIVILDAIALFNGIDGVMFMTSIAIISGLGGYILMKESPVAFRGLADAIELFDRKRKQGLS